MIRSNKEETCFSETSVDFQRTTQKTWLCFDLIRITFRRCHTREIRNCYRTLVWRPEGKLHVRRPTLKWVCTIQMALKETVWGSGLHFSVSW
jgi:hypothetical protein